MTAVAEHFAVRVMVRVVRSISSTSSEFMQVTYTFVPA